MTAPPIELRAAPHSRDAECAVLGALLLNASKTAEIAWLKPEHFWIRNHATLYRMILDCIAADVPVDAITLSERMEGRDEFAEIGGIAFVTQLAANTLSAANVIAYAEIVREMAARRELIDRACEIQTLAYEPGRLRSHEIAANAAVDLLKLDGGVRRTGPRDAKTCAVEWYRELEEKHNRGGAIIGLATPWSKLNAALSGLCEGDLVVLAGRPGMGKTTYAMNIATCAAFRGESVLIFSLEMTAPQLVTMAVSSTQRIPRAWLRDGAPDSPESNGFWPRVTAGVADVKASSLMIEDAAGLTVEQMVASAKRTVMRKGPVRLIIVDHLGIVPLPGKQNPATEIGHVTRTLKGLAKSLKATVLLLSQLNRSVEARANKRPMMSDLRDSGCIEQDADVILFSYRDDYYAEQEQRESHYPGLGELIIAKNRAGEAGKTVWTQDALQFARFDEYEGPDPKRREAPAPATAQVSSYRKKKGATDGN